MSLEGQGSFVVEGTLLGSGEVLSQGAVLGLWLLGAGPEDPGEDSWGSSLRLSAKAMRARPVGNNM